MAKTVKAKGYLGHDRREYPRFEYPLYISYKKNGNKYEKELLKASGPFYSAIKQEKVSLSRNISVAGISFIAKRKFSPGTRLAMKIWSPVHGFPLIGLAEVIWQRKRPRNPGYLTGVAFASLEKKEELRKLLNIFAEVKPGNE